MTGPGLRQMQDGQAGSGSVLLLGVLGAALLVAAGAGAAGRVGVAAVRAASAADAAALAASLAAPQDGVPGGPSAAPCAAAGRVAAAAGARLLGCTADASGTADVLVGVSLPPVAAWAGPVTARSRAGPEPAAGWGSASGRRQ